MEVANDLGKRFCWGLPSLIRVGCRECEEMEMASINNSFQDFSLKGSRGIGILLFLVVSLLFSAVVVVYSNGRCVFVN